MKERERDINIDKYIVKKGQFIIYRDRNRDTYIVIDIQKILREDLYKRGEKERHRTRKEHTKRQKNDYFVD